MGHTSGGDLVQGDKVAGDKVGGDKVMGDKITYEAPKPIVPALHQLPPPPVDFTGREADIAAILDDIAHGAIISGVRGMGGIGKTALALVIAECVKAQYPDAQFFLSLRGASERPVSPLDAMQAVIRAYHPTAQLPDDATQVAALYRSVLAGQRAIVLLDDARDARQVLPLLPPASCLVLITTRQTFTVPGLHARKLETLSPVEARDLLIAIAPSLNSPLQSMASSSIGEGPGVRLADDIARLCGYLPLALRAAASLLAATPDLNPRTYAARLRDERTRLTTIGAEGVDVDVAASLNLSYAQLSPDAARVFRLLSVFPADFDAAAEEAVCEDADHIHLSQLVRFSLVEFDPPPTPPAAQGESGRYRLHDLVRLFAANLLPSPVDAPFIDGGRAGDGGSSPARYRHAAHYKDVLQQAKELYKQGSDSILQGLTLFDREWPNIQAGQAWAVATFVGADLRVGPNVDPRVDPNVDPRVGPSVDPRFDPNADPRIAPPPERANTQVRPYAAEAARLCDDYPDAGVYVLNLRLHARDLIRWREQALAAARYRKNRTREGIHLGNLGLAYADLGETRQAIEFYEQQLIIDRAIGDRRGEGAALGNLGNAYAALGETRKAIEYHEQRLVIARAIGDRRGEGNALGNLGIAYFTLGETRRAIEYHEQYLAIAREIGDRRGEGNALGNLGLAYAALGETRQAIEFYEQQLVIAREIGDRRGEGNALMNTGNAHYSLGEYRQAIEYHEQALPIFHAIGGRRGEGNALWNMALALDKLGERAQAIAQAEVAWKIYEAIEDPNAAMVRQQLAQWNSSGERVVDSGQKKKRWQFWK